MAPVIQAEVHFHQQDQASVFSQSNIADSWNERLAEIGLFSFYSLRMFSNLGTNETSDTLALMLQDPESAIEDVSVAAYSGYRGRHSFLSSLRFNEGFQFLLPMAGQARFDFKAKGFGFLARGVGYYGPASVLVLLRYLAEKRESDQVFLEALMEMAGFLGQWHLAREIGLRNQNELGLPAMTAAAKLLRRKNDTEQKTGAPISHVGGVPIAPPPPPRSVPNAPAAPPSLGDRSSIPRIPPPPPPPPRKFRP